MPQSVVTLCTSIKIKEIMLCSFVWLSCEIPQFFRFLNLVTYSKFGIVLSREECL